MLSIAVAVGYLQKDNIASAVSTWNALLDKNGHPSNIMKKKSVNYGDPVLRKAATLGFKTRTRN